MTDKQKMNAANAFVKKWTGIGEEIKDDQSYWHDLLQNVFGAANVTSRMECQKPVTLQSDCVQVERYLRHQLVHRVLLHWQDG